MNNNPADSSKHKHTTRHSNQTTDQQTTQPFGAVNNAPAQSANPFGDSGVQPAQQIPTQPVAPVSPSQSTQPMFSAMPQQGQPYPQAQPYPQQGGYPNYQGYQQYAPVQPLDNLTGLKGWLTFFMIVFCLNGLGWIIAFFSGVAAMVNGSITPANIAMTLLAPVACVFSILAAANIAMRKKIGRLLSMVTLGVFMLVNVISTIINIYEVYNPSSSLGQFNYAFTSSSARNSEVIMLIGMLVAQLVFQALMILYFRKSRRVENTLVN